MYASVSFYLSFLTEIGYEINTFAQLEAQLPFISVSGGV
jgi:hypothetical protein